MQTTRRWGVPLLPLVLISLALCSTGAQEIATDKALRDNAEDYTPSLKRKHSLLNSTHTWRSQTELGLHSTYREIDGVRRYGYHRLNDRTVVVERRFDHVHDTFSERLGGFQQDGKWGFVNEHDEIVIEPKFEHARPFNEGFAVVQFGGRAAFVGRDGKILNERKFESAREFSEGLAAVQIDGKWGFIDQNGEITIEPTFVGVGFFSEGLASFSTEDTSFSTERTTFITSDYKNIGYIDRKGRVAIKPQFSGGGLFSEGLAPVRVGDRWDFDMVIRGDYGFINRKGDMVILPKYFSASSFLDGRAAVQVREPDGGPGLWGYIAPDETWFIAPRFRLQPTGYDDGIAGHYDDRTTRWMDYDGRSIRRPSGR